MDVAEKLTLFKRYTHALVYFSSSAPFYYTFLAGKGHNCHLTHVHLGKLSLELTLVVSLWKQGIHS